MGDSHSAFLVSREGQTRNKTQTDPACKGAGKHLTLLRPSPDSTCASTQHGATTHVLSGLHYLASVNRAAEDPVRRRETRPAGLEQRDRSIFTTLDKGEPKLHFKSEIEPREEYPILRNRRR